MHQILAAEFRKDEKVNTDLFYRELNDRMYDEVCFWYFNVLLQVKERKLQLGKLFLRHWDSCMHHWIWRTIESEKEPTHLSITVTILSTTAGTDKRIEPRFYTTTHNGM